MAPLSIDKSGAACGNGILFSIPDTYSDWENATNFVWTLTSPSSVDGYTLTPVISGSKDSHFFVPYDGIERDYEVSVYAESSTKVRSLGTIESQTGQMPATPNFSINGYNCYDIKKTAYDKDETSPTTAYGRWESRTALDSPAPDPKFSYSVLGSGTLAHAWTIFDPDGILTDMSTADLTAVSIDIQFKSWVLADDWLINQPTHERIVVLTCVVTEGSCEYVVSKEIRVGDRDCCARLTDTENNIYSAVRFGSAGCWMTENLAVTKNEKRGTTLPSGPSSVDTRYDPRYRFPATSNTTGTQISLEQAQSSDLLYGTGIGKPGLLYNWAAAVGAASSSEAQGNNYTHYTDESATPPHPASKATSKEEDICPVGWYLPSDAEWTTLEREIAAHPGNYTLSMTSTLSPDWSETTNYRNNSSPGHGEAMRNSHTNASIPGKSNPKESGFSSLLVGHAYGGNWYGYAAGTSYWSSSSTSSTDAWRRVLSSTRAGVYRDDYYKYYLLSVRCKKLD
jgi:uncharacterized protein (TIGR02145 family)